MRGPSLEPVARAYEIGLISLGCPKNLVDSEVMLGLAQEAGHSSRRTRRTPTCSS